MSAKYTIAPHTWLVRYEHGGPIKRVERYQVLNPSGIAIAHGCSWRVARKIVDLYNADVEWRRWCDELARRAGAVSLQEEA